MGGAGDRGQGGAEASEPHRTLFPERDGSKEKSWDARVRRAKRTKMGTNNRGGGQQKRDVMDVMDPNGSRPLCTCTCAGRVGGGCLKEAPVSEPV